MNRVAASDLPRSSPAGGDPFLGCNPLLPYCPTGALLERHARQYRDKIALFDIDQDKGISFGRLHEQVDALAGALISLGLQPDDRVILLGDETLEKLVVWLAIWRAGGCVCALNVEASGAYFHAICRRIAPRMVLHDAALRDHPAMSALGVTRHAFGRYDDRDPAPDCLFSLARRTTAALPPERNCPSRIASIFCTSGTTGAPKIVLTDHVSMWLCGLEATSAMALGSDDRTLEYRSFSWTSPQSTSLMPWLQNGLTLNIAARFSSSRFFDWIAKREITFVACVPTVINMLLERAERPQSGQLASLKRMSCSTAPLSTAQWERFERTYGVPLLQYCGMSEAGVIAINRHDRRKIGTVGRAAQYQDLLILDSSGNRCPAEVEGELTICGPETAVGIATLDGGYEQIRGKRLHTGDLAVMDDEGFIRITGRLKDVVIRGGVNISPVEIDQVLLAHPGIAEAATIGVPDRIYGEDIVTFVVPSNGSHVSERDVVDFCTGRLPQFKVPKRVFLVDELPRSDRGKVLRDALKRQWATLTAQG
jgi:acyl-coenzyme A synthetase/AMP-(fatty) acid ligase